MIAPPKDPWEILPAWQSTLKDRRFSILDRTDIEDFLRHHKFEHGLMTRLRDLLAAMEPVGRFTDDQVIEAVAWKLATRELVLREPVEGTTGPAGGGGGGGSGNNSSDQADSSSAASSSKVASVGGKGSSSPNKAPAQKTLHWIGVKVVDTDGKIVKDVTVNGELSGSAGFSVEMVGAAGADGIYKTDKIYTATTCDFTFPTLHDVEWWPMGGSADPATSTAPATAVDGDCLLSIASNLGFRNYHSIWDQPQNDAFKKGRRHPNKLLPGDVVQAPDKQVKLCTKDVDQIWTFIVKARKPFKVRMILVDKNDKPLGGKKWELKSPQSQSGTTGADGLIELTVLSPMDFAGTLEVTMKPATTPPPAPNAPPAAAPANPPPYPPAIVAADYKDHLPEIDYKAQVVTWTLHIGGLPPVATRQGTLARLLNLGFGVNQDSAEARVTRAVKAYQLHYQNNKNGSGKPADIQEDAGKRHDQQ